METFWIANINVDKNNVALRFRPCFSGIIRYILFLLIIIIAQTHNEKIPIIFLSRKVFPSKSFLKNLPHQNFYFLNNNADKWELTRPHFRLHFLKTHPTSTKNTCLRGLPFIKGDLYSAFRHKEVYERVMW